MARKPTYRDTRTARFAAGQRVKAFQGFAQQAYRRLAVLEAATTPRDLMNLKSNHFEALKGDRRGQFSIRIHEQWRICFAWPADEPRPCNIEIADYH